MTPGGSTPARVASAGDPPPIGDYGIIGDCRTAALISRAGSVDWLCLPRFDSSSIFARLLDTTVGGSFHVRPVEPFRTTRRYVGSTNVLETTFATDTGAVRVTDFMPVADEVERDRSLWPEHELLRRIEGVAGAVDVDVRCEPRPEYGRIAPDFRSHRALGYRMDYGSRVLMLRSEIPLAVDAGSLTGTRTIREGERAWVSLGFASVEPAVLPPLGELAESRLASTLAWWETWASRCTYEGPFRDAVVRSALALKLLAYAPSGAIVAAPTTSLPETPGGTRNWDYRYCWLRDASLTTRALHDVGYAAESTAFIDWMLHATRLTWPRLQVLYDVYGNTRIAESELTHLAGYGGARPVRIGNAAKDQLQLDVYGEVVEATCTAVNRGARLDDESRRMLVGIGRTVCAEWEKPDEGIWEIRSEPRHHTVSKAMCWVALDRLLQLDEAGHLSVPRADFENARARIRDAIEACGYDEELRSYVSTFHGDEVDASLLLLGLHGYADPRSPRMRSTHERIRERLGANGLLYRYRPESDDLPGREGAFGICSFWSAELYAMAGERNRAREELEHLLSFANDLGLFAEEIDPETGAALGNFPQAFTHVGVINAVLDLGRDPDVGLEPSRTMEKEVTS